MKLWTGSITYIQQSPSAPTAFQYLSLPSIEIIEISRRFIAVGGHEPDDTVDTAVPADVVDVGDTIS